MKKRRKRRINTKRSRGISPVIPLVLLLAVAAAAVTVWLTLRANRLVILTPEQVQSVLDNNEYESEDARAIAQSAVSLLGRVHYFWGGKSYCKGPDPGWGEPREVTSAGSPNTGKVIPYGLDCSGYITWIYLQLDDEDMLQKIGEGTWNQWQNSTPIEWSELKVGDLVFQNEYPGASANHVAVCIGYMGKKPVFAHCSSAQDNVVVTTAGGIFRYARRPNV